MFRFGGLERKRGVLFVPFFPLFWSRRVSSPFPFSVRDPASIGSGPCPSAHT
ncbi:hypothetical protein BDY24DRAFT_385992 [Mrakia frigida]|uniref:uncharacterized protein n=1 Tax=Mrakia frigida TaxID=29902 RepID=UPI003FCBFF42